MPRNPLIEIPVGEEISVSPADFLERRSLIVALGGLLLGLAPGTRSLAATGDEVTFKEFLSRANPLAQSLVGDQSDAGQEKYLRSIAALAAGLADVPIPEKWNNTNQGVTPESYRIGFNPGGDPFRVLHWRLEPGAVCRPHAHTYGNVLSIGLEGTARVNNYEVVGDPDYGSGGTFMVRRTVDQLFRPGSMNLVSLERNYIHGFVAGKNGARGLDITTPLKPKPAHKTPYLEIGDKPVDEFARTYEAAWEFND